MPISTVLDEKNEVILVYEMNGQELPMDHGYPLRLMVPGHIGVRCCKWVESITISDQEA